MAHSDRIIFWRQLVEVYGRNQNMRRTKATELQACCHAWKRMSFLLAKNLCKFKMPLCKGTDARDHELFVIKIPMFIGNRFCISNGIGNEKREKIQGN
jgi:hypothetical protein